jgi:hypothetical protein
MAKTNKDKALKGDHGTDVFFKKKLFMAKVVIIHRKM